MKVLALETSTRVQSVGLAVDGRLEALVRHRTAQGGHSRDLLGTAMAMLDRAGLLVSDLDALAVGLGPGGFTGVRIGISLAKGLAAPTGIPVHAATSDRIVAACFPDCVTVVWAEDARKGQVYGAVRWGGPAGGERVPLDVWTPEGFRAAARTSLELDVPRVLVGSGFRSYASCLGDLGSVADAVACPDTPDAAGLLSLVLSGRTEARPAAEIDPRYIRPSEAEVGRMASGAAR